MLGGPQVVRRAPPQELGYAEITSNQSGISTETDVTGLTVTFTAGSRPVMVEAYIAFAQQLTAAGVPIVKITDGSNVVQQQAAYSLPASSYASFNPKRRLSTLTPGTSYTFKVRAVTSGASATLTVNAGATLPAFIRAYEV